MIKAAVCKVPESRALSKVALVPSRFPLKDRDEPTAEPKVEVVALRFPVVSPVERVAVTPDRLPERDRLSAVTFERVAVVPAKLPLRDRSEPTAEPRVEVVADMLPVRDRLSATTLLRVAVVPDRLPLKLRSVPTAEPRVEVVLTRLVVVRSVARAEPKVELVADRLPVRDREVPTAEPKVEVVAEIKPSMVRPVAVRVNRSRLELCPIVLPSRTRLSKVNEPPESNTAKGAAVVPICTSPVPSREKVKSLVPRAILVAAPKVPPKINWVPDRVRPLPAV